MPEEISRPDPVPQREPALVPIALALAALALGRALTIGNGHVGDTAIAWLTVAIGLAAAGVWLGRRATGALPPWALDVVLTVGVLVQVAQLLAGPSVALGPGGVPAAIRVALVGLGVVALVAWTGGRKGPPWALLVGLLVALHACIGVAVLRAALDPHIDVHLIHRGSLDALLAGTNPYALTFPNIYPSTEMYGPEQLVANRLAFGYCYPPIDLLWVLPGHLAGDYRGSHLAALALAALLVADVARAPGGGGARRGVLAAAALLTTPRGFYVLEHGWTEPLVALAVVATVWSAVRAPRLLPWALGVFIASKQYSFIALPAVAVLLLAGRRPVEMRAVVVRALGLAVAVTLPFFLWDARAFVWGVLVLQFHSPFRPDALSYLAWIALHGGPRLSSAVGFLALIPAATVGVLRAARTPAGFAAATALAFLVFFATNKQAFCNYYHLCIATLLVAVAAHQRAEAAGVWSPRERPQSPATPVAA